MKIRSVTKDQSSNVVNKCIVMGWIQLLRLMFIIVFFYLRRLYELIVFVKQTIKIEVTSKVKAQTQVSTLDSLLRNLKDVGGEALLTLL